MIKLFTMRQRSTPQRSNIPKNFIYFEKSLEINTGQRATRLKLVKIYWRIDRQGALQEYDQLEYINSFYDLYGTKKISDDKAH